MVALPFACQPHGAWRLWPLYLLLGLALGVPSAQAVSLPIQHWVLPSGARVYLVESTALPMLDVQIDFDAGSRRDPPGQTGLAAASASLMSAGVRANGAEPALDENALGEAWADLGGSFGASAGTDRLSVTLRTLTFPDLLAGAVSLAARQLALPSYPESVWTRDRERWQARLREADTRAATQAMKAFSAAVYGDHPYGAQVTAASLDAIDTRHLRDWHRAMVLPCRARVTLVGAVSRERAGDIVQRLLAGLPQAAPGTSGCPALPDVPEVVPLQQATEIRLKFPAAQAQVLVGQPGFARRDPDFLALTLGNHILGGGGFTSRLTTEVRERRGLSYSVYSYFSPGRHAGAYTVGLQTRPDQADQALAVARETVARFIAEGPTEQELRAAKDNLIGGFPLRLDSNRKLLDNVASMAWNDLPLDYLAQWTRQVEALTAQQVKAAMQRVLQPDRMVTVVLAP